LPEKEIVMQVIKRVFMKFTQSSAAMDVRTSPLTAAALGLMLSLQFVPAHAVEEVDQEQKMDHSQMDHSQMDHSQMDHSQMDHSQMDHSQMDHSQMDHSSHAHHMVDKPGVYKTSLASYMLPDVKLLDKNRATVSLREVLGGQAPVILNFVYTSCTAICPLMSATFRQVQDKLGAKRADVLMVSISIDPENDTPERLKEYAGSFNMGPQWIMLTGSLADSIQVQNAFDVFAGEKMNHKPATFLKAKGQNSSWVRIDGLAKASDILKEYDKLAGSKAKK
jgi:protein SCO1/2